MKAHICIDSRHKLIHSVAATAANIHDSHLLSDLLHGNETAVWGDSAYRGQTALNHALTRNARDLTRRRYRRAGQVNRIERRINEVFALVNLFMLRLPLLRMALGVDEIGEFDRTRPRHGRKRPQLVMPDSAVAVDGVMKPFKSELP